ncbi:hypothetical protein [Prosthecobacter sp.]|uniref:hypothetical protein n=1 Tax=Prosthecobacter sp. TaxID=1965333 RepID=UPI0037849047
MIAVARTPKKKARLSQVLSRRLRKPAPPAVRSWLQEHLRMPESDLKRMKRLYDKVMNETISGAESVELDELMEASAAMDVLRARILLGDKAGKTRAAPGA